MSARPMSGPRTDARAARRAGSPLRYARRRASRILVTKKLCAINAYKEDINNIFHIFAVCQRPLAYRHFVGRARPTKWGSRFLKIN